MGKAEADYFEHNKNSYDDDDNYEAAVAVSSESNRAIGGGWLLFLAAESRGVGASRTDGKRPTALTFGRMIRDVHRWLT